MFPVLLDFGTHDLPLLGPTHLFLPTYGVLFALAAVLAWWWFLRRGRSLGLPEDPLFNLGFYTLLAGILGAKALLVVVDWRSYLQHPADVLGTLRSAGVLVGGVIAGASVFVFYARRHGLPVALLTDAIAAPLAAAQALGRLGCHAAGCCWGVETVHPWLWVKFTDPVARAQTGVRLEVPLVPTQLIQMAHDLLLAGLLTWLWRRRPQPPGTVAWTYVLLYSIGRGVIEFWRGDAARGLYFAGRVSTSQIFSVLGIALAAAMLLRGRRLLRGPAAREVAS
jgi:phosphatidylglycerol:prolipoprotein diacylglycerol transferase